MSFNWNEIVETNKDEVENDMSRRRRMARRLQLYEERFFPNYSASELDLLDSINDKFAQYGDNAMFSEKQENWMDAIIDKYDIPLFEGIL
jgi:hypothetical protein